jgi:iduronate 2-sulfatase
MRTISVLAACLLLSAAPPSRAAAPPAPQGAPLNLVVIYADDLNASIDLPTVSTPNLDALAQRGVRFERAYAAHPMCNPSRAAMLAGQLAHHAEVFYNGDPLPPTAVNGVPYLPRRLRDAGYYSAGIGKIHHDEQLECWDEYHDFTDDPWISKPVVPHVPGSAGMIIGGPFLNGLDGSLGKNADTKRTDEALVLLAEAKARLDDTGQPFELWLGLQSTHDPFIYPQKFSSWYWPSDVPPLPAGEQGLPWQQSVNPQSYVTNFFYDPNWAPTAAEQRVQALLAYFRCISFVDEQVGRVLATLDALDLADSTVVVFLSDHGWSFSEHAHIGKPSGYEEDIVAPLLLAVPSATATHGEVVTTPVSQVDLYPTLLEVLGVGAVGALDGHSLVPLLDDVAAPHAPVCYTTDEEYGFNLTRFAVARDAVTGELWKLAAWEHDDNIPQVHQLYNLTADPGEYSNLATDPSLAWKVAELRQVLAGVGLLGPGARNFHVGNAGQAGVPQLEWTGIPQLGTAGVLQLGNTTGVPKPALLSIAFSGSYTIGGLGVVPLIQMVLAVGPHGLSLPVLLPTDPVLHEVPVGLQLQMKDPTAPKGIAASRALSLFLSL